MQLCDDAFLRKRVQTEQKTAATNQIHSRERGIVRQILAREDAHVPNRFRNEVSAGGRMEVILEALRRDVSEAGFGVHAGAGNLKRRVINIGGEDLKRRRRGTTVARRTLAALGKELRQHDGDRISFLAGGTSRNPNANRRARRLAIPQERWENVLA